MSLIENLHNMENGLIAKDIANGQRDLENLSLKYIDRKGHVQGYLLAYEGSIRESDLDVDILTELESAGLQDQSDRSLIYISDFATLKRNSLEAGKMLKTFIDRYQTAYLAENNPVPVLMLSLIHI